MSLTIDTTGSVCDGRVALHHTKGRGLWAVLATVASDKGWHSEALADVLWRECTAAERGALVLAASIASGSPRARVFGCWAEPEPLADLLFDAGGVIIVQAVALAMRALPRYQ